MLTEKCHLPLEDARRQADLRLDESRDCIVGNAVIHEDDRPAGLRRHRESMTEARPVKCRAGCIAAQRAQPAEKRMLPRVHAGSNTTNIMAAMSARSPDARAAFRERSRCLSCGSVDLQAIS